MKDNEKTETENARTEAENRINDKLDALKEAVISVLSGLVASLGGRSDVRRILNKLNANIEEAWKEEKDD